MVAENQVTDTCNTSSRTNNSKMSWVCLHQPQPLVNSTSEQLHKKHYIFQCLSSQIYLLVSTYITTFPSIQSSVTKHFICSVCWATLLPQYHLPLFTCPLTSVSSWSQIVHLRTHEGLYFLPFTPHLFFSIYRNSTFVQKLSPLILSKAPPM